MKKEIITSIEIEIGGVKVKVSPTEANALFDALGELLNRPVKQETIKEIIREPYAVYPRTYISPNYVPYTNPVWCTDGTLTATSNYTISSVNSSANIKVL